MRMLNDFSITAKGWLQFLHNIIWRGFFLLGRDFTHASQAAVRVLKLKPFPRPVDHSCTFISTINQLSQFYINSSISRWSDRHVGHGLVQIYSTFTSQFITNFPEWPLKGKLIFCQSKKLLFLNFFQCFNVFHYVHWSDINHSQKVCSVDAATQWNCNCSQCKGLMW